MKTPSSCKRAVAAAVAGISLAGSALADPVLRATISPQEIGVGDTANLTVSASGTNAERIAPPAVPGLEFMSVSQSQRLESINGVTTSSISVTYQVSAQHPGVYTIPAMGPGAEPLQFKVDAGSPVGAAAGGSASNLPAAAHMVSGGAAFVRLRLPTHRLYVGESVPLEVQVGTRDGMVASMNGLPTLNGDAFTLDNLAAKPDRQSEEIIGGKQYTVFTWRSTLAAVKPGKLSLTMETPLTIRVNQQGEDSPFGDLDADGFFNDPAFRNFFGTSTQKDIVVTSAPAEFNVLALPSAGRPENFSGAVGSFSVTSSLADDRVSLGDPETLRLTVSGSGNFPRVNSPMLGAVANWKTYRPTAKYSSSDGTSFHGEKTFEQPIIATASGKQSVPALTFSYFDPKSERYIVAHTVPLNVQVIPGAPASQSAQLSATPPSAASVPQLAAAAAPGRQGLPPGRALSSRPASLTPAYFTIPGQVVPSLLVLAFPGAWLLLWRRERQRGAQRPANSFDAKLLTQKLDQATASGDAREFFKVARSALQRVLGSRWHIAPDAVTVTEVESRLGQGSDVRGVLAMAEEAIFSQRRFVANDLERWRRVVVGQLREGSAT